MRSARLGLAENPAVAARVWMIPVTKLVIVDDHDALREGLAALLPGGGIEVVAAAGTVAAALDVVERFEPDVALVDLQLPDGSGIDLTRELLARRPELGAILYTVASEADLLYGGLDSGARGYALKGGSMAELNGAIQRIAAGGSYVDPRLRSCARRGRPPTFRGSRRASARSGACWPRAARPTKLPTGSFGIGGGGSGAAFAGDPRRTAAPRL